MQGTQQQERRALNEGIELSYIEAAGLSASIKTHRQTGRGVLRDLYETFYFNVSVLVELTSDLDDMVGSEKETKPLIDWLGIETIPGNDVELLKHCIDGIAAFKQYKKELSKNGLLALPTRGR